MEAQHPSPPGGQFPDIPRSHTGQRKLSMTDQGLFRLPLLFQNQRLNVDRELLILEDCGGRPNRAIVLPESLAEAEPVSTADPDPIYFRRRYNPPKFLS